VRQFACGRHFEFAVEPDGLDESALLWFTGFSGWTPISTYENRFTRLN
jgi:hypothetical protein